MVSSNAERFLRMIFTDAGLKHRVLHLYQAGQRQEIELLAAQNACPASFDEIVTAYKGQSSELADDQLEQISGGSRKYTGDILKNSTSGEL